MVKSGSKNRPIFTVHSNFLNKTVVLYERTWRYKILVDHPEVRSCVKFAEDTIRSLDKNSLIFRKIHNPCSVAVFEKCPYLQGLYDYLKIAFVIVSHKDAVLTTMHGLNNLPTNHMEPI